MWWVVILGALLTYATRIGGYLAIARFRTLHPRVEQALEAVPAAVLVTIAVPGFVDGTWLERAVLAVAGLAAFRFPHILVIFGATALVALMRAKGF
ncbi:AzlD family protein [Aureimonas endophytica]|nr:AzlD domain-containing protein [Aureimonas endophytica]